MDLKAESLSHESMLSELSPEARRRRGRWESYREMIEAEINKGAQYVKLPLLEADITTSTKDSRNMAAYTMNSRFDKTGVQYRVVFNNAKMAFYTFPLADYLKLYPHRTLKSNPQ